MLHNNYESHLINIYTSSCATFCRPTTPLPIFRVVFLTLRPWKIYSLILPMWPSMRGKHIEGEVYRWNIGIFFIAYVSWLFVRGLHIRLFFCTHLDHHIYIYCLNCIVLSSIEAMLSWQHSTLALLKAIDKCKTTFGTPSFEDACERLALKGVRHSLMKFVFDVMCTSIAWMSRSQGVRCSVYHYLAAFLYPSLVHFLNVFRLLTLPCFCFYAERFEVEWNSHNDSFSVKKYHHILNLVAGETYAFLVKGNHSFGLQARDDPTM